MGELNIERNETKESLGKNVRLRILLMRHGEKLSEAGELTEEGKQKIFEQFKNYDLPKDKVRLSSPNVTRNIQTLRIIEEVVGPEKLSTSYVDTAFGSVPESLGGINYGNQSDFSDEFAEQLKEMVGQEGGDTMNQYYLDFGAVRPDVTTLSPQEAASRLAKQLLLEIKMARLLKADSEVDFIHITGTTFVFPLLNEILKEEIENDPVNENGDNFVEKLGGELDFGEGLMIEEMTDEEGNLTIPKLSFRGKEYDVDIDRLQTTAQKTDLRSRKSRL